MARRALSRAAAFVEAQRSQDHGDVLLDGQPREEREALEHDGDPGIDSLERRPVVEDLAAGGADQAGHDAQDRGLAAAGRAEQGQHLVGPHVEGDVLEHAQGLAPVPLEGLVDPLAARRSACSAIASPHLVREKRVDASR